MSAKKSNNSNGSARPKPSAGLGRPRRTADRSKIRFNKAADSHPIVAEFGRRVKYIRDKRGLSYGEIGDACGLSAACFSAVVHGRYSPSLVTVERVARALDMTVGELFSFKLPPAAS